MAHASVCLAAPSHIVGSNLSYIRVVWDPEEMGELNIAVLGVNPGWSFIWDPPQKGRHGFGTIVITPIGSEIEVDVRALRGYGYFSIYAFPTEHPQVYLFNRPRPAKVKN